MEPYKLCCSMNSNTNGFSSYINNTNHEKKSVVSLAGEVTKTYFSVYMAMLKKKLTNFP